MSANVLTFRLKKEIDIDKDFKPIEGSKETICLYACIDGIWALVDEVDSIEQVRDTIKPENLEEVFSESLSDIEYEHIMGVLNNHPEYYFYDESYNYNDRK